MSEFARFDKWFEDRGFAAIVLREHLMPVEGTDGIFFPATYAAQQGYDKDKTKFQGGYNIDVFDDGSNVVLVDSVGSQANRIEPIFSEKEYSDLVPQIIVTFPTKGLRLNLLSANHRAADAIVRCSGFEQDLRNAFREVLRGNAETLAQIAPTSLVFGAWDSRDTQAKLPRIFSSTVRAFNVRQHTRSANFLVQMTIDLENLELLPDARSEEGFKNALASKVPGGVQLTPSGSIRRDTTVNLAAIRRLTVLEADGSFSTDRTTALRRYILGLALVALTAPQDSFLRAGCNLVPNIDKPREFVVVGEDGKRTELILNHNDTLAYTREALKYFNIRRTDLEKEFIQSSAEKAMEGKPEKLKGQEVVSVDADAKTFKIKGRETQISVTDETTIKKGKTDATFEDVVKIEAKLDVEVLNNIAKVIRSK
ncbi:MAG: type I-U CRISPR-associated protein Cas7 [Planctomycetaceae bacterium]|nr:type I-U CRISPR-associated protein Cas7 [Planctomycetaceae bacterium]